MRYSSITTRDASSKARLIASFTAALVSGALIASSVTAASAQENDPVADAIDEAPLSSQVINEPHESASIDLATGEGSIGADNSEQGASISYDLDSGVSLVITAQDDENSAGAATTAQVLTDNSVRLLTVFTDPDASLTSSYSTEIPEGWTAAKRADGGYDIVPGTALLEGLREDGIDGDFVLATIDAPWAIDANGRRVETSFQLEGNQLKQSIEPDENTVFPVTADPSVVGHGYYFSIYYNKSETRSMRDTGAVVGFILAAGAAIAALPGGVAVTAVLYTVGAGAVAAIATVAGNASGEGRCLKLDVPSFIPTSVKC
ncbi:hypothetical protein ACFC14_00650 [Microbacterium sp. NPDC055988]|uniref:hypothetical protein n=2 Tax=Microbacterium TaxID=33882 RepID=UPI0035E1780F